MRKCKQTKTPIPSFAKSETLWHKKGFASIDAMVEYGKKAARAAQERAQDTERRKARERAAKQKREDRDRKKALKTRSQWMKDAQKAFNAFIRERDRDLPCVCCGEWGEGEDWQPGGKWDAGHFLGRGAYPELRFVEINCHKQLKSCNAGSSKYARKGRTVAENYRERLINKIGLDQVEWLEGPHEAKHYTIDDLKQIESEYKAKLKELKNG